MYNKCNLRIILTCISHIAKYHLCVIITLWKTCFGTNNMLYLIYWYGKWGVHAAYVYNKRYRDKLNGVACGVDYRFALPETAAWTKWVNGLNLIAEYDSKNVNIGAKYAVWKDYINLVGEWYDCKYPSIGVYFKLHLK